jgi:hypothetical protein
MPFADLLIGFSSLPLTGLVRGVLLLALLASFLLLFRPLLSGLVRALVLTVRPRLSRQERSARRQGGAFGGRA